MIDDLELIIPKLRSWLDEDERIANAAGGFAWWSPPGAPKEVHDGAGGSSFTVPFLGYADHIGRFHPERILDEVAAKRRIIETYETVQAKLTRAILNVGSTTPAEMGVLLGHLAGLRDAIRITAASYRNWAGRTPDGELAS
ncbi:DUF6221 family protein [Kitasatospora sp. McL0602]|uniref:DUF6221 family protein n=1 Tax=Kitasatospora sp. McL0602 TaxID=3439530 RepID=UPI003F89FCC9